MVACENEIARTSSPMVILREVVCEAEDSHPAVPGCVFGDDVAARLLCDWFQVGDAREIAQEPLTGKRDARNCGPATV